MDVFLLRVRIFSGTFELYEKRASSRNEENSVGPPRVRPGVDLDIPDTESFGLFASLPLDVSFYFTSQAFRLLSGR